MAGRGMGAASRGGGAVGKGPKNKMISEPSKSTGKVLMMAKGGYVPKGTRISKFRNGTPLPSDRATNFASQGAATGMNASQRAQTARDWSRGLAVGSIPFSKFGTAKKIAGAVLGVASGAMPKAGSPEEQAFYDNFRDEPAVVSKPQNEGELEYRRGGPVRKKDYLKKKASMMRKGGMADKKGRAMKSKSKDARGRAMRGR